MQHPLQHLFVSAALAFASLTSHAEGTLFRMPTRPDAKTTLFWEAAPDAKATVFLFPGGGGGFGPVEGGKATGGNFLVRSAPLFLAQGFKATLIKSLAAFSSRSRAVCCVAKPRRAARPVCVLRLAAHPDRG